MSKMSTAERQQQQILQRPPTTSVTNQRQECRPIEEFVQSDEGEGWISVRSLAEYCCPSSLVMA